MQLCKVSFSIGKAFSCEVLCNVIEMVVCHVILGRPWRFDMGVWYDGRANTYTLEWKNEMIILLPSSRPKTVASDDNTSKTSFISVTGAQCAAALHTRSQILAQLIAEENRVQDRVPAKIQSLLQQVPSLATTKLPNKLPPIRAIQHQIDLISDLNKTNISHFHMSPKEHQILQ